FARDWSSDVCSSDLSNMTMTSALAPMPVTPRTVPTPNLACLTRSPPLRVRPLTVGASVVAAPPGALAELATGGRHTSREKRLPRSEERRGGDEGWAV